MPDRPPSDLKRVTAQYHAAVQGLTDNALADLQGRWQGVQATLDLKIKRLTDQIAAAQAKGETVNVAWLTQAQRLEQLRAAVQGDVSAFADGAADIVANAMSGAVDLGQAAAQAALAATVPPGVNYTFGVPPSDVTEELAGALQPGSPLNALFGQMGSTVAALAQQALFTGVALGEGPRQIARRLTWATNMAPRRAEVIARTETMRSWRHAQFANYQANRDVVQQWMWAADFGPRCCGACIAMDGTFHSVDTELDDHICGRCSAIPITRSWADILADGGMSQDEIDALGLTETSGMAWAQSRESGESWLARQSAEVQNQILGPAKAEAWRQGAFPLERVVGVVHDPQWGSSIRELSLRQMGIDAQTWLQAARQAGTASTLADEEALAAAHAESSVSVAAEQRAEQVAQAKAAADEWYAAIQRSIDAGRAGELTAEEAKAAADEWFANVKEQLRPGGLSVEDVARAMEQRFGLVAEPAALEEAATEAAATTVTYASDAARARLAAVFDHLDSPLTEAQVAGLAGAPAGSTVTVSKHGEITVTPPDGRYISSLFVTPGEEGPTLLNWQFTAPDGSNNIAVDPEALAMQVRQANELGVDGIHMKARIGSADYAELPQLGYNAPIEQVLTESRDHTLPAGLEDAQSLSEVLATPEGRAWWAENGLNPGFDFDPRPGSQSYQVLDAYLRDHGLPGLDEAPRVIAEPAAEPAAESETTTSVPETTEPPPATVSDALAATPYTGPTDDYLQRVNDYLEPRITQFAALHPDMTLNEYKAAVSEHLQQIVHEATPSVRVPSDALVQILSDGRLKSAHDIDLLDLHGLKTADYQAQRARFEEQAFGYSTDAAVEDRPISGYLTDTGADNSYAMSYGDARLVLNPDVLDRTTVTFNDSLDYAGQITPRPVDAMAWDAFNYPAPLPQDWPTYSPEIQAQFREKMAAYDPLAWQSIGDYSHADGGPYSDMYLEAQFHGGVQISDIKEIQFTGQQPPDSTLTDRLDALGIKWSHDASDNPWLAGVPDEEPPDTDNEVPF